MQPDEQREQKPRILNGRFRLQSQLAKGGMGVTYRAWDEQSGRPVVVKMPKRALYDEPGFLERFDREVRATIALDHPSIVRVVDHGADAGEPFLVMEFLPGGSLASRISQHTERGRDRMPASHLHAWLPRIAAALDHAHARGVLHRDVKPANIFFDARGLAHLGDFGIAKILEDSAADIADPTLTGTHIALGTHAYMAPERLAPRAVIDGRADQYALAICAFEAITGAKPFRGDTMNIVIEQATLPPPDLATLRPDIPASACQAVAKALAKRPADRFETCSDFAAAVLAEIPPTEQEAGFAWLQCPACSRLVRLPEAAAGRTGRCPRCKAELVIAHRLEGLWLPEEYGAAAGEPIVEVSSEPSRQPQRWQPSTPRSWAAIAAVAISAMLVPWLWRKPPAPPRPHAVAQSNSEALPPEAPSTPLTEDSSLAELPSLRAPDTVPSPPIAESPTASSLSMALPQATTPPTDAPSDSERMPRVDRPEEPSPDASQARAETEAEWVARRDAAKKHFDEIVCWVKVGDASNPRDSKTGYGVVDEDFYVAQYELTNADYCKFLNASRAGIHNEAGIGERAVNPQGTQPGIRRDERGLGQGFVYEPVPDMADKPAVLNAADAIALTNWLHNIHRAGTDTIAGGAYAAATESLESLHVDRTRDALFFIPTIDEWTKAAYFNGKRDRYYLYPTATSKQLVPVSGPMPAGRPSLRGVETAANFAGRAAWEGAPDGGAPTDVGMNGAPSEYGAFDMGGNLAEWVITNGVLVACGGDFRSPVESLMRDALESLATMKHPSGELVTGVRLARSMASATKSLRDDPYQRLEQQAASAHFAEVSKATVPAINAIDTMRNLQGMNRASAAVGTALKKLQQLENRFNDPNNPTDDEIKAVVPKLRRQLENADQILKPMLNQQNGDPVAAAAEKLARQLAGQPDPFDKLQANLASIRQQIQRDLDATAAKLKERYGN